MEKIGYVMARLAHFALKVGLLPFRVLAWKSHCARRPRRIPRKPRKVERHKISINYNTALNKENKAANISYQAVNFNFDVKPILSDKCYTCHGPDDKARKANLRLDIEQGFYAALEDNPNHFVIDKNNPNESEILKRIDSENSNYIMPPPESNLKL